MNIPCVFDRGEYQSVFPIAFLMREYDRSWWFRIHSLPNSKRYPSGDGEWRILYERQYKLAKSVLGDRSECRIYATQYSGIDLNNDELFELQWRKTQSKVPYDDVFFELYDSNITWHDDLLKEGLRAIAEDEVKHLSIYSSQTKCLMSPYDGGVDIFSLDRVLLEELKKEFSAWRSSHPLGL